MSEIIPANRFLRLIAAIIDLTIVIFISFKVCSYFGEETITETGSYNCHISGFPAALLFLAILSYYLVPETLFGQTLAKFIFGLKVISSDGYKRITVKQSFLRHVCDIADWLPFSGIIFFIVTGNNEMRQRTGDFAAKTIVINKGATNKSFVSKKSISLQ